MLLLDLTRIGNKISHYRMLTGLSQTELAERLHVSRQAVSSWEQGKTAPTIDNVLQLTRIFCISFDELLCLEDPSSIDPGKSI